MRGPAAAEVLDSGEPGDPAGAGREAIVFKLPWVPVSPDGCVECRFLGTARQSLSSCGAGLDPRNLHARSAGFLPGRR